MSVNIAGSGTAGNANVTNNNLHVVTPVTESQAGFVTLSSEIDAGLITSVRKQKSLESSNDYRLRIGADYPYFSLNFEGAQFPNSIFRQASTNYSIGLASGFCVLNSTSLTTASSLASINSYRSYPVYGSFTTYVDMWIRESGASGTNSISEFGLFYATGSSVPTDGVFFRRNGSGTLKAIVNFNTVETEVDIDPTNVPSRTGTGLYSSAETNHFLIATSNDSCQFWINNILVAEISAPSSQPNMSSSSQLPLYFRVYNTVAAGLARRLEIGHVSVTQGDLSPSKPFGHIINGGGGGSYQTQMGSTSGPTVTRGAGSTGWPTSGTARAAGTWTATSAPATNSLGGMWISPAISTLTSDADYPVFAYQVPSGGATFPAKTLYITSVTVGPTCVTTVAATNPILLSYAVGIGSTVSATTATESGTAVAARIVPIGNVSFTSTAAVGTYADGTRLDFSQSPLVCPPGCFVQFIVRPFGTVTSNTLVVCGTVTFAGYFE